MGHPLGGGEGGGVGGARDVAHSASRGARLEASAPEIVQQARLMDSAGTAWHAVKCGNLEMITQLFPNKSNVYARGPVGENVMHLAMLLNTPSTLAIARYLVKLYGPPLVNCPFQDRKSRSDGPSMAEGQTALHIAIVNRDIDMVKFLVAAGANIRARAWGSFFAAGGSMYYGEYPLSFAACTGQKEVVAFLKRHGALVNGDKDQQGNTALHMCVIHGQPDMYDFLVEFCAASDEVRNYAGLTPLVLAAQLGDTDMFQHIYNRRRRAFYTFGTVTSYSLALREIDTVQDEDEYVPNALEVILRKGHLDMLEEPLISTLLRHKWEAFARTQFFLHFVGYLLMEVSQTVLIWLISSKSHWNGSERASQEYLGLVLAVIMSLCELMDYIDWSRECYHRRLTTITPPPFQPPLYPIPGEHVGAVAARQGIFHRLSQRVMGGRAASGGGVAGSSFATLDTEGASPAASASSGHPKLGGELEGRGAGGAQGPRAARPAALGSRRFSRPLSVTDQQSAPASIGSTPPSRQPSMQANTLSPTRLGSTPLPAGAVAESHEREGAAASGGSGHGSADAAAAAGPLGEGKEGGEQEAPTLRTGSGRSAPIPMPRSAPAHAAAAASAGSGAAPTPASGPGSQPLGSTGSGGLLGEVPLVGSVQAALEEAAGEAGGAGGAVDEELDVVSVGLGSRGATPAAAAPAPLAAADAAGTSVGTGAAAPPPVGALVRSTSTKIEAPAQRQRTRARSGGGDLPSSISALKRVATSGGMRTDDGAGGGPGGGGGDSGKGGGAALGGSSVGDVELGGVSMVARDPHKSRSRAFLETTYEGFMRMLSDPWLFVWHLHLVLTFMHFITWQTTYGGVGGPGPKSRAVREFDDVVVSLMGLTGWLAVIYFFRGFKSTGKLAVILERCIVDVCKFVSLYVLWNIGFTLAFFTMTRGVLYVTNTPRNKEVSPPLASVANVEDGGFSSIGLGMMSLINLGLGLGLNDYGYTCNLGHEVTAVFCTLYYLLYMATSAILLLNLLVAMIIRTYNTAQKAAEAHWRRRWAIYVVKAERRMPSGWVQRLRLGQPAWDPKAQRALYSHVFETEEGKVRREDRGSVDAQIRAAQDLLDSLRRQRGGGVSGSGGGGGGDKGGGVGVGGGDKP